MQILIVHHQNHSHIVIAITNLISVSHHLRIRHHRYHHNNIITMTVVVIINNRSSIISICVQLHDEAQIYSKDIVKGAKKRGAKLGQH